MKHEEYAIQRALVAQYRLVGRHGTFLFHPFNKAANAIEGAFAKAMGVLPGVPDLIGCRDGRFCALEVKTEKGHLSANQQLCREAIWEAGGICEIGFGPDDAAAKLKALGFL